MSSEPSKTKAQDRSTDTSKPRTSVNVDGASRDKGQSKSSSGTQQPVNRPIDRTNQSSGAASAAASKSNSGRSRPWHSGGRDRFSSLQRQNRDLESRVDQLTKALSLKEKEHREELCKKESELSELKRSLCLYDECSEVDIGNMVDGINTRIQSFTRNLAMKWAKEASKASDGGEDKTIARDAEVERLKAVIGIQLVDAFDTSPGRTTFTLQLAWQASIVAVVKKILSFFSATMASSAEGLQIDDALRELSEAVREGEVQPAYGRWRLVTHQYIKNLKRLPNEEGAIQTYVNEALDFCRTASRLAMKNHCPDDESFGNAFQAPTKEIMEEAFKLLTTIQEKMATTNYEPYICENGRSFRPEEMALSKQDKPHENDRVVCTIGLGMLYSRKNGREVTSEPPPKILFTKPQVLTEENLSDMIAD